MYNVFRHLSRTFAGWMKWLGEEFCECYHHKINSLFKNCGCYNRPTFSCSEEHFVLHVVSYIPAATCIWSLYTCFQPSTFSSSYIRIKFPMCVLILFQPRNKAWQSRTLGFWCLPEGVRRYAANIMLSLIHFWKRILKFKLTVQNTNKSLRFWHCYDQKKKKRA